MPDEALLALVKNQLGSLSGIDGVFAAETGTRARLRGGSAPAAPSKKGAAQPASKRGGSSSIAAAAPKRRPGRPRKATTTSAQRQETLDKVERIVKASTGLSASEVAKQASIPQTRAAAALKELKLAKRIFQGGDRRFARYAGDAKTADSASMVARKNAAGPSRKAASKGGRKRAQGQASAQAQTPAKS
ncbi:Histone-like protein [Chondromyces apiculatus DSM 436]|uniref:Histone-like protein n=2 Tax=Chondromyces apiculatus TaxID=51 RepID=A0A017TBS0_9BACT|nr:Histone-like protein [Chondromyces apiculatus DSM 436]